MSKRGGFRRVLRTVHLWIGLIVGVPLVVVCLSGSALVWHDALENWMHPERRHAGPSVGRLADQLLS
jgi:uncharacterized iron-regulated membrane protein